jgi:hypothetical protein
LGPRAARAYHPLVVKRGWSLPHSEAHQTLRFWAWIVVAWVLLLCVLFALAAVTGSPAPSPVGWSD